MSTLIVTLTPRNDRAAQVLEMAVTGQKVQLGAAAQAQIGLAWRAADGAPVKTIDGKNAKLKKSGKNLILETEDGLQIELVDFYAAPSSSLAGGDWNFADTDGLSLAPGGELCATPEAGAATPGDGSSPATAPSATVTAISPAAIGAVLLGAVALGGGSSKKTDEPEPQPDITAAGTVTLGKAVAGLLVEARDKDNNVIASALTDENGNYSLKIGAQYAGQKITLSVTDPNKDDGLGYIDEATGESKDIGSAIRATLVLDGSKTEQTAQITPLTELATRQIEKALEQNSSLTDAEVVTKTNQAVAQLFGLTDVVSSAAPTVVGSGSSGDSYGQALALLSGMDSVAENQGASSGTDATLDRLEQAITINLSGTVSAQFNGADVDTLNLISQAISEVSNGQNNSNLADALSDIALNVAKSAASTQEVAVFISAPNTVLGAGSSVTVSFRFDAVPTADQLAALKTQLRVQGGSLTEPVANSGNAEVYTATFTQSGGEAPKIWLEAGANPGVQFFSNDLQMQFDVTVPVLSIARIEGVDADANGTAGLLDTGDTLRVVLSASESVQVTGTPVIQLNVGGVLLAASYVAARSGTKTLVFEATVPNGVNDADGVTVESLAGGSITDFASNAAVLQAVTNGLAPKVDTTAPTVLSQSPLDASVVGNAGVQALVLSFSEAVRLGTSGTLTLKRVVDGTETTVQTWAAGSGVVSSEGLSVSFALSGATLAAGEYTVSASSGAFTDLAGNLYGGDLASGGWNFTVGRVSLGIDRLFGDSFLSATETANAQGLAISGTVTDPDNLLAGMNKTALRVGFRPMAGGETLWANVNTLEAGKWTATLASSEASKLQEGAYTVQALIDQGSVKSSASSVVVVDHQAKFAWGSVAGDDTISTLEQGILATGKTLSLPFLAENKSTVSITLTNKSDASKTLSLSASGSGVADSSLKLTAAQVLALGSGQIELKATVTDAAGNTNSYSKNLVIEDATPRLVDIQLSGSANTLVPGDKVFAAVAFDKAVQLSGVAQLKLVIGSTEVFASYEGASQDGKTLNFGYTVLSGQSDSNGISLPANALVLAAGASLKDAATRSKDAAVASRAISDIPTLKVDASAPADLAFDLLEAGITGAGLASASGRMVTINGLTVSKVNAGGEDVALSPGSSASSLGAKIVQGSYGTWTVGADGTYRYTLDNQRAATQALKAGEVAQDVLLFTPSEGLPGEVKATIQGSNDGAQIAGTASGSITEDGTSSVGGTLTITDVDAGQAAFQTPVGLVGIYGSFTFNASTGAWSYVLDNNKAATQALRAGEQKIENLTVQSLDGTASRTLTVTVVGSNDGAAITGTASGALTEDSAASVGGTLTTADVDSGQSGFQTAAPFDLLGQYGSFTFNAATGVWAYALDNNKAATQALKAGEQKTDTLSVKSLDGTASQTITVTVTGSNDTPTVAAAVSAAASEGGATVTLNLLQGAADVDGDPLSVSKVSYQVGTGSASSELPAGLTLSGATLTLDPSHAAFNALKAGATQTITASYTITDGQGGSVNQTATFTVTGTNDAPTAEGSIAAQTAVKGQAFNFNVAAYFADVDVGDTRSYALSGPGAQGLSIDANGNITGTLGAARSAQTVTVTLTDGGNLSASQSFDLRVVDQVVISRIYASEAAPTVGKAGDTLRLVVEFSEGVTITGSPTLTLDINGTAVTATYDSMVSVDNLAYFTATVPNNNGNAIRIQAIEIPSGASVVGKLSNTSLLTTAVNQSTNGYLVDNTGPVIATSSLSMAENSTDAATLLASDSSGLTVSWSLAAGGADNDLFELSPAGALRLKAAKNFEADARSYSVLVKATDAAGNASTQTIAVSLTDVNEAPTALSLQNALTSLAENTSTSSRIKIADIAVTDDALGNNTLTLEGADAALFEIDNKVLYLKAGTPLDFETKASYAVTVKVQDSSLTGSSPVTQDFVLSLSDSDEPPTASTVASEAPRAYDQGALSGTIAESFMLRFSEAVNADLLQEAMAQGKVTLQGANGVSRNLGAGAVLEAYTPSQIVVSGLSEAANGTYSSLWDSATNSNTEVPSFANGFGLSNPSNFTVNNSTTIYKKTNIDGSVWYIWQQTGWRTWMISQDSPLDGQGNAKEWFISNSTNSTDPSQRTAVLGVSGWSAKSGALQAGVDPWAGTSRIIGADLEPNGWGRTYVLALGAGNNAQAGDTLVIDKSFVKDRGDNLAINDISFVLPSDITRPTVSANAAALVQGLGSDGSIKTSALVQGDTVRVTVQMSEAVTVSSNSSPSVTLELDTGTRQAVINRALSFVDGATSSAALVFDYVVKEGDSDAQGGIMLGALNRNNANFFDLFGNRLSSIPSNLNEVSNVISIAADSTPPTLASVSSADKGIVSGGVTDTLTFRFNEAVNVDHLEAAFASGQVRITSADGSVVRNLGAGAKVEATYPTTIEVAGFSAAADGTYTTLWSPAAGRSVGAPTFEGFSTSGTGLTADVNYAIYKHTDGAGQNWYLWRPEGWTNYVLTPASSVINGLAQSWWASGNGFGTGNATVAREGVLLAGEWYANQGMLSSSQSMWRSDQQLAVQPTIEASGFGTTFSAALGTGHDVQQGDKIVIAAGAVKDVTGNSNSAALGISLPADISRPVLGSAVVKGYKNVWNSSTQTSSYTETTDPLGQYDLIRVEIPVSETIRLYHSGGSTGWVALDIGGQTRHANLNLQLSSVTGSAAWGFTSNKLVYEYWIQGGDNDTQGGITVGAMSRGNVGMYDAAGNRPWVPADVPEVANSIAVVDTQSPNLYPSYASGNVLVLSATEALDASHLPSTNAFLVVVNGQNIAVQSVAVPSGQPNAVVLTLASTVANGANVQVSYSDPTGGNDANALQDLAGNDAFSLYGQSISAIAAPTIQYTQSQAGVIELSGDRMHFSVKFSDLVAITGAPRLVLSVSDGSTTQTAYASYQSYTDANHGQLSMDFVYDVPLGTQGQVSVVGLELNGGSITAYHSAGVVAANTTLTNSSFFTPYTWVYPDGMDAVTGDAGNNLLAPWFDNPENTPRNLTSSSVSGGAGNRDVLAMSVLLPSGVNSESAASAYSLSYNVTAEGVRQVLLKNGSTTVDTYAVPSDGDWPGGVEQLLYHLVYKDSTGAVQFADAENVLLTLSTQEYVDPANANQRWVQGGVNSELINLAGRDAAQTIFVEAEQGNDTIVGHDGTDIIRGGSGNNLINAGKGDDQVVVRRGSDTIDGGEGTDTLRFDLAGREKKITVDSDGVIHVYTADGSWDNGFTPDANGWVERYRLSSDYGVGGAGSNRIAVFDVALGRNVAIAANMERLQWRLDDNFSGRTTNSFQVGTAGDDTISNVHVALAGAGHDNIALNMGAVHANDWREGNRAVLIDGGSGRDMLLLNTYVSGKFAQVFESNVGGQINVSRVIKNIEGLQLNSGGYVELSAQDIRNLYAAGSNTNAWGGLISGLDASKLQFLVAGAVGSLELIDDTQAWTLKTNTVTYNGQTYDVYDHGSGVQLLVDTRVDVDGNVLMESSTSLSISSATQNGTVMEGNNGAETTVTFTVTRSGDTAGSSSANWSLVNYGSDSADFVNGQAMNGTVMFTAGETSKTIIVKVLGDNTAENNETFGVRLSNPSVGTSLAFAETQVSIVNDDGNFVGNGPAPVVTLVRAEAPTFAAPGDVLKFVVEMDQLVSVQGTPRLALTLFDPTGVQQSRTVYADFVPYSNSGGSGTWSHQSTLEFSYTYAQADAVGPGWMYRINSLEHANGSSIKSVEGDSYNQPANLVLNGVAITAGTWLYTSFTGTTGTANNDMLEAFDLDNGSVPRSLDTNSASGGAGNRDVMGIPVLLPSSVTTAEQARSYYLNYEVTTDSNGNATGRYVKLYQSGNATAVDTYTLPLAPNAWPTDVEALGYFLQFKDASNQLQDTGHPGDHIVFWKTTQIATDSVTGDVAYQGSYRGDTINLSATSASSRVLVRGNQGSDTITGHDGTDAINGDGGNDVINAGAGNDMVFLSSGADTIDGGVGIDILAVMVKGQETRPQFSADGKLWVQSAYGTWANSGFTPDASGYQLDWTFDFNGQTGAISAQRAGSGDVSVVTGFEKIRLYHDEQQVLRGDSTFTFDVVTGSASSDSLTLSQMSADVSIVHGLDGDDVFTVDTPRTPVMMGGNGNDSFILKAAMVMSEDANFLMVHGGTGTDSLKLGDDVSGAQLSQAGVDDENQISSFEVLDITGSTAQGAVGNTIAMTAAWLRDLTDAASTRSFTVQGDANDRVNLQNADNWQLQSSDVSGYALYQTTYQAETLKLYVASTMASTVIV